MVVEALVVEAFVVGTFVCLERRASRRATKGRVAELEAAAAADARWVGFVAGLVCALAAGDIPRGEALGATARDKVGVATTAAAGWVGRGTTGKKGRELGRRKVATLGHSGALGGEGHGRGSRVIEVRRNETNREPVSNVAVVRTTAITFATTSASATAAAGRGPIGARQGESTCIKA